VIPRVAWRVLTHEKARSLLAVGGVFVAVLLIFMQLGFYFSVPKGGMFVYDSLRFDLLLVSRKYTFQVRSQSFPRRRLYQAMAVEGVADAVPLYQGGADWVDNENRRSRRIFLLAFDPTDNIFAVPEIESRIGVLRRPDTMLFDTTSKAVFGDLYVGRVVEIEGRDIEIGGLYRHGVGFLGLGVGLVSDQNLIRIFPERSLRDVELGLVTLQPGADAEAVAERLRAILPADTRVFTRAELAENEIAHWVRATSTGLVFGVGAVVAFVVGLVILFQTLSTQIVRNLSEYATLKAMGFTVRYIAAIVVVQAVLMALIAFGPALGLALMAYDGTREATGLPVEMTATRVVTVLALTVTMCVVSAVLALGALRRADPVDLF